MEKKLIKIELIIEGVMGDVHCKFHDRKLFKKIADTIKYLEEYKKEVIE